MKRIKLILAIAGIALLQCFHASAESGFKAHMRSRIQKLQEKAQKGNTHSLISLSYIYADGLWWTEKNPNLAFSYAQQAAQQGLQQATDASINEAEDALILMARYLAEGIGVTQDKLKAMQILTDKEFSYNKKAKLYYKALFGNLYFEDIEEDDAPKDAYLCFKAAEGWIKSKVELKHMSDEVPENEFKKTMQCYYWSLYYGNIDAWERISDLRFMDRNNLSGILKEFQQAYPNDCKKIPTRPLYSLLGPGQAWSDDPLVAYSRILYNVLQIEYEIDKDIAIKDMRDFVSAGDWAWTALKNNWGQLRDTNMPILKLMSECGIEAAAEVYERALLSKD